MSRATTTADLISTEQALSERQAALEQLQAQWAVLADQVALSTLRVVLSSPTCGATGGARDAGVRPEPGAAGAVRPPTDVDTAVSRRETRDGSAAAVRLPRSLRSHWPRAISS